MVEMLAKARRPKSGGRSPAQTATSFALEWLDLHEKEELIRQRRQAVAEILIKVMRRLGASSVEVDGERAVALTISRKKSITKEFLTKLLGKRSGEAVWRRAPESISEYLSKVAVLKPKRQ